MTNWPMVPLGEVLQLQRRWVKVDPLATYEEIGVRCFGNGIFHKSPIDGSTLGNKRVLRIEPGDLVFNNVFAWEGAVAVASEAEAGKIGSHRFVTYTVDQGRCSVDYLRWFFKSEPGLDILRRVSPGSAGRNRTMSLDQLPKQDIRLPPRREQQQLVEYLDAINTKLDEAKILRNEATQMSEALLQSVRETLFQGIASYTLSPLSDVAECRLGKMLSGNQTTEVFGTPYLRNANIQWDRIDLTSIYRMNVSERDRTDLSLEVGDILVCEGGDIGKCAIWNNELEGCIFQKALHRVRADRRKVLPRYLHHHLIWLAKRGDFSEVKTQTTIAHLTGVVLKQIPIRLPTLDVQEAIVSYLDHLRDKLASSRHVASLLNTEMKSVMPSVLNHTFNSGN